MRDKGFTIIESLIGMGLLGMTATMVSVSIANQVKMLKNQETKQAVQSVRVILDQISKDKDLCSKNVEGIPFGIRRLDRIKWDDPAKAPLIAGQKLNDADILVKFIWVTPIFNFFDELGSPQTLASFAVRLEVREFHRTTTEDLKVTVPIYGKPGTAFGKCNIPNGESNSGSTIDGDFEYQQALSTCYSLGGALKVRDNTKPATDPANTVCDFPLFLTDGGLTSYDPGKPNLPPKLAIPKKLLPHLATNGFFELKNYADKLVVNGDLIVGDGQAEESLYRGADDPDTREKNLIDRYLYSVTSKRKEHKGLVMGSQSHKDCYNVNPNVYPPAPYLACPTHGPTACFENGDGCPALNVAYQNCRPHASGFSMTSLSGQCLPGTLLTSWSVIDRSGATMFGQPLSQIKSHKPYGITSISRSGGMVSLNFTAGRNRVPAADIGKYNVRDVDEFGADAYIPAGTEGPIERALVFECCEVVNTMFY